MVTEQELADLSWKTAKPVSNGPTRLVRFLAENDRLSGNILDYGAGKLRNTTWLRKQGQLVWSYDPYCNELGTAEENTSLSDVIDKPWNWVFCNFVMNVLPPNPRETLVEELAELDAQNVVIEVQSDLSYLVNPDPFEDGFITGRGTFQKAMSNNDLIEVAETIEALQPNYEFVSEFLKFGSNSIGIILSRLVYSK